MVHLFVIYRLYNTEYKFHVTPIVIVAMRYVPKCLIIYLKMTLMSLMKVLISKLGIKYKYIRNCESLQNLFEF